MRFAGLVWKLLVGVKDLLVLIFMLMFFALIYSALAARPAPLGEGVLALDLDGVIVEQPEFVDGVGSLAGISQATKQHSARELIAALREAKDDSRVKAVALDLDGFLGGGQATLTSVGQAIGEVRKSGKKVVAFATGYSNDRYQLAAHASEIWMPELGAVAMAGPGGDNLYYKGLLDKLGVTANIYRAGVFKSAVEPYIRTDMSPEARENAQALGGALLETWREDVARGRPAATAGLARFMADPVAVTTQYRGDLSRAALDLKLVDRIGTRRKFEQRLAELGGEDDGKVPYRRIGMAHYLRDALDDDGGPIGVVTIAGTIIDGHAAAGTAGGETIARLIEEALRDETLKALVVRIDSPGGSVLASERIRQALLEAKEKGLPIVASMGSVAASGGYWVSTPADFVFAEPATITGSIGVFGIIPSFQGTLGKLGLGADGIRTTPLSGEPDVLNGPSPAANALIQAGVDRSYAKFLAITAAARRKSPADIHRVAQGRVWDGGSARQLGLVDGFGDMDEAIAKAAQLAKLDEGERGVTYIDPQPDEWSQLLSQWLTDDEEEADQPADALALLNPASSDLIGRMAADIGRLLSGPSIQAHCLECPTPLVVPGAERREQGWLGALLAKLI